MSVFKIRMGIPGMRDFWNELLEKEKSGNISSEEKDLLTSLFKSIKLLHTNPRHPSLKTHEIKDLSKKYKIKVWQSYLDQGKLARRIYWAYGPDRKEITILGIEPHPEDKKRGSYKRLKTVLFSSLESRSEKPSYHDK